MAPPRLTLENSRTIDARIAPARTLMVQSDFAGTTIPDDGYAAAAEKRIPAPLFTHRQCTISAAMSDLD
jgi:hypothetical protein